MLIVHIITRLIRAGADENTMLTCLQQADDGHDVVLIHGAEFDDHYHQQYRHRVRFVLVEDMVRKVSVMSDARTMIRLYKILKDLKPHVVHTHTSKAGILGRLAARMAVVPAVIHGVHIVPFLNVGRKKRMMYLGLEKIAAVFTHAFINVSHGTQDLFLQHRIGKVDNHHVVHSGFDLQRYHDAQPPSDQASILGYDGIGPRPPVIVMMAALTARKRHIAFLDAFQRLTQLHPDVRLLVCGEGEERGNIEDHIVRLGIQSNVVMLGFRADPERIVAMADLCVLCSEREGLPRVIMQYLAGGKPCVVSHLPGIEEVVDDGVNGLIVPSANIDLAIDAVHHLLTNKDELKRLAQGARATDLSNWDAETMWPKMQAIYEDVLQSIGMINTDQTCSGKRPSVAAGT
jgi:glycosyltransferase involved in cell wall biosynthesis